MGMLGCEFDGPLRYAGRNVGFDVESHLGVVERSVSSLERGARSRGYSFSQLRDDG